MSTTVVHRQATRQGPSGKTIGMVVAGVAVAAALGFAIANQPATESLGSATQTAVTNPADAKFAEQGAALEAGRQTLLLEATKGIDLSPAVTGAVVSSHFLEINTTAMDNLVPATVRALEIQDAQTQSGIAYRTEEYVVQRQAARDKQRAQWESRVQFLIELNGGLEPSQPPVGGPR